MTRTLRKVFGENVKQYRLNKDLTQEALGFECDMPDVYISKIERGVLNIGIDNIERLAKALKIQPHLLFIPESYKNLS